MKKCIFVVIFSIVFLSQLICAYEKKMSYKEALDLALEKNPDVIQTKKNLEKAVLSYETQKASNKFSLNLNLAPYSYRKETSYDNSAAVWVTNKKQNSGLSLELNKPVLKTGGLLSFSNEFSWQNSKNNYRQVENEQYSNDFLISFSQPLFTYNDKKNQLKKAELDLDKMKLTYAIQKLNIENTMASYYYNVYKKELTLDIAFEEFKNNQTLYEITKKKVEAGLLAKEELYQTELNTTKAEISYENAKLDLQNAYDDLKQTLGIRLGLDIDVDADTSIPSVTINLDKAVKEALENRNELRQKAIDIKKSEISLQETKQSNDFQGNLNLTYGIKGLNEKSSDIFNNIDKTQIFGISFDLPLFDWGLQKKKIESSEINVQINKLSLKQEQENIRISIRKKYRNLMNLKLQIESAQKSVNNALLTYELNKSKYEHGNLTSMDLSLYQTQLSEQKSSLISAIIEYKLALLDFKLQTLYDFEKNQPLKLTVLD